MAGSYIYGDKSKMFSQEDNGVFKISSGTMIQPVGELIPITIPAYDGENQPTHPDVIRFRGGWNGYEYWMAFTPHTNGSSAVENPSIVASNNGIDWEVPEGITNPIFSAPAEGFYADTALVFVGNKLYMYWGHFGVGASNSNYRSETTDGITWSNPVAITGATDVTNNGLTYLRSKEWVAFTHSENTLYKITSEDGLTWRRRHPVHSNVGGNIWHSQVYYDGSGFHFLINAYGSGEESGAKGAKLYYGYSKDGSSIAIDPSPLLLPEKDSILNRSIYTSKLVPYDDQTFIAYISTVTNDDKWLMGAMKVRLTLNHSDVYVPLQSPIHRVLFDALEIRDSADHYYGGDTAAERKNIPEFSSHKEKSLFVQSSLNQSVTIRFTAVTNDLLNFNTLRYNNAAAIATYVIPAGASPFIIDKIEFPLLGSVVPSSVKAVVICGTAPTSGQLTMTMTSLNS